ncbi:MAG: class I SAM-dependent methyltransferase [Planctomycetota bacterium]
MNDFASCWRVAATVNGWLTRREAEFLFTAARSVPGGGTIVEIGSFFGRSTICLARGSRAGGGAHVHAIDPQLGSPKHTERLGCRDPYPWFLANLERAGIADLVTPHKTTSLAAAAAFEGAVDLLFLDGSHEEDDVAADYAAWFPRLRVGGLVAFHDSWHMRGVRRVTEELLRAGAPLTRPRLVDTITVCTKSAAAQRHAGFVRMRAWRGLGGFLRLTCAGTRLASVEELTDRHCGGAGDRDRST